jgi:ribosomal protein S17
MKMNRTIVIRREYLHFITKYQRYERRHKNVSAHCSPAFRVEVGDNVTIGQCRPLSKTVRCVSLSLFPPHFRPTSDLSFPLFPRNSILSFLPSPWLSDSLWHLSSLPTPIPPCLRRPSPIPPHSFNVLRVASAKSKAFQKF